jgi:hypothetical protein
VIYRTSKRQEMISPKSVGSEEVDLPDSVWRNNYHIVCDLNSHVILSPHRLFPLSSTFLSCKPFGVYLDTRSFLPCFAVTYGSNTGFSSCYEQSCTSAILNNTPIFIPTIILTKSQSSFSPTMSITTTPVLPSPLFALFTTSSTPPFPSSQLV